MMHDHRKWMMDAIERVASGHPLKAWTRDTIYSPGHCAQLTRETTSAQLGYPPNGWPIAEEAYTYRNKRGGTVRWASDYEKAAVALGLVKPNKDRKPGDVLYWPYKAKDGNEYGHTAIYAGERDGKEWVLENSDANPSALVRRGAKRPLGKGQVFLTPLSLRGEPRLTAWVSAELRDAERKPLPTPKPAPRVEDIPALPLTPARRLMVPNQEGVFRDQMGKIVTVENSVARIVADTKSKPGEILVTFTAGSLVAVMNLTDPHTTYLRFHERGED